MSSESRSGQERLLIDAIARAPDNEGPRRVYADWLLERGDPRGELIQLLVGSPDDARVERAKALLAKHEREWTADLRAAGFRSWTFDRGLVTRVTVNARTIARLGPLMDRHPIHQVKFRQVRDFPSGWWDLEGFDRVSLLNFNTAGLAGKRVPHLLQRVWPNVQALVLSNNGIGQKGARILGERGAACFPQLRWLGLDSNNLKDAGGARFLRSELMAQITHLDLSNNDLHEETFQALASSEQVERLECVQIDFDDWRQHRGPPVVGLRMLPDSEQLKSLRWFRIRYGYHPAHYEATVMAWMKPLTPPPQERLMEWTDRAEPRWR